MGFNFKLKIFRYNGQDKSVTVIDGTNMFYRACLTSYKDTSIELDVIVNNFSKMLKKALKYKSKYVAIVFDSGLPNFRHQLYKDYKSNRKTHIKDKDMKLKLVKSILQFYGFKIFDSGEFEADDLIGSLARFCRAYYPVQIVSEDKDFLQCVRKNVKLSKGGFLYDRELCKLKFGVKPSQFIDYLSLTGDSADCIPGADGWGAKNTQKYLAKCGTIENILDEKLTKSLMSVHKLDIELMRKLVRIKTNISVVNSMEELEVGTPDEHRLRAIAQTYHVNIGAFL